MVNYIRQMTQDVVIHNQLKSYKGYTLFAPVYDNTAWLIDMDGNVCHYWQMEHKPGIQLQLLKNGNLMWLGKGPNTNDYVAASSDHLVEVDWEGNEVWRYDDPSMHHDFLYMENDHIMIMRFIEIPEKISKNIKGGIPGTEINGKILGVQIREIDRQGNCIWQWNNYDHFDADKYIIHPYDNRQIWGYTNSVDVFKNGDILLSVREFDKVIRIDKKTGEIIWEWGPEHFLGHQHDASVTKEENITIFDNGIHRRSVIPEGKEIYDLSSEKILEITDIPHFTVSRALEVNPKTDDIVWEYIDPLHYMHTNFCGSTQKLPNNNYLLCEGVKGELWEISEDKEVVWKYISPFVYKKPKHFGWTATKQMFQAHRHGLDFEGFNNKDLDPERFEWIIREKSREKIEEEKNINDRLAKAGY